MNIFVDDAHRLRALWRVLIFLVLWILAEIAFGLLAGFLGAAIGPMPAEGEFGISRSLSFVALVLATALAARATERRTLGDVGFGRFPAWVRDSIYGFAFGAALVSCAVLPIALVAPGQTAAKPPSPTALVAALGFFTIAAAYEELLCRGFLLQAIASGLGPAAATVLTSAAFAALHLANPNVTTLSTATTFAAGVLLSIAYFRTRNLWLATGLHLGWNYTMGFVYGLPISGIRLFGTGPAMTWDPGQPDWLTGGPYGPEGGVVGLAAVAIGSVVLAFIPVPGALRRRASAASE